MFKDAEKMGSTFHKSKKIVRPGESIPEQSAASSPDDNAKLRPRHLRHEVEEDGAAAAPVGGAPSSVEGRISVFKNTIPGNLNSGANNNSSSSGSPNLATTPRQSGSSSRSKWGQHQQQSGIKEAVVAQPQAAISTTAASAGAAAGIPL